MLTTRSIKSGLLRDVPLPYGVGEGLRRGVPRMIQLFKSIELPGHNIKNNNTDDPSKINRWAGFSVGMNNLTHLEDNLQALMRGKTEDVD